MNVWQLVRQVEHVLAALAWTPTGARVFGDVLAGAAPVEEVLAADTRLPLAYVRVADGAADAQTRRLHRQRLMVDVVTRNESDRATRASLLGGAWVDPDGDSRGKGILELVERVLLALESRQATGGVTLRLAAQAHVDGGHDAALGVVAWTSLQFEALVDRARSFPPPTFDAAPVVAGAVTLTWRLRGRFDALEVVVVRLAGATAPADRTDGVVLAVLGALVTTYVDAGAGSGTWSYGVIVGYDQYGAGAADTDSAPLALAGVVVP